jgi:uncharacterized membrane protein
MTDPPTTQPYSSRPSVASSIRGAPAFVAAGIMLGIGLGGFLDGIVLHQILRWHHMLSSTAEYPATTMEGLEANMVADGLFHLATWVATVAGVLLLWRALRRGAPDRSGRRMIGWVLAGWGLFNVVEGVVDHHVLGIHHVREAVDAMSMYDIGFLAFGAGLVVVGTALGSGTRSMPVTGRRRDGRVLDPFAGGTEAGATPARSGGDGIDA